MGSVRALDAYRELTPIAHVRGALLLWLLLGTERRQPMARAKGKRLTMPDGTVQVAAKAANGTQAQTPHQMSDFFNADSKTVEGRVEPRLGSQAVVDFRATRGRSWLAIDKR